MESGGAVPLNVGLLLSVLPFAAIQAVPCDRGKAAGEGDSLARGHEDRRTVGRAQITAPIGDCDSHGQSCSGNA